MSDTDGPHGLIALLRGFCGAAPTNECTLMLRAADEIERLQSEVARLEDKTEIWSSLNKVLQDENKALHAQLKTAVEALKAISSMAHEVFPVSSQQWIVVAREALAAIREKGNE